MYQNPVSIKKLNGTESQRTPDQVSCDRAIGYTGFFSGFVKRGSCWRFLGKLGDDFCCKGVERFYGCLVMYIV